MQLVFEGSMIETEGNEKRETCRSIICKVDCKIRHFLLFHWIEVSSCYESFTRVTHQNTAITAFFTLLMRRFKFEEKHLKQK